MDRLSDPRRAIMRGKRAPIRFECPGGLAKGHENQTAGTNQRQARTSIRASPILIAFIFASLYARRNWRS